MNQRILEIAKNAGLKFPSETALSPVEIKFAQLIVAECNEVLRLVPYNSDRDFGDEAIYQEAIAKHFRV